MKLNKEPRELGEEWMDAEPTPTYIAIVITVVVGLLILFVEYSGVADHIINSFN
jgi:hypothetical protein